MNRKLMTEQELMDWVDFNLELGSGERGETYVTAKDLRELFKGMMLVPTKDALLPRAKAIYPIQYCAMVVPEHVLVLSQITTEPMRSSKMSNVILLDFIRSHEPDYPDMHTEKK